MPKLAILCVDDEVVILNSVLRQIQEEFDDQYVYETAENAEEALEVLDELYEEGTQVVIIVSDWLMPGMKGDELLVEVQKRFPGTVKILLTGQADDAAIERAQKEADLHHLIPKPWTKQELINSIKSGIEKL
ncbi:MAG: response regulator [Microcoleus sp. PH2017_29_MFU_D_A]|jgi:CheY-like chemotaxis protein|uniref:response regulator n=1 Tax=unclassified Microcoleus TaxID=2642155 RepID=UPI001D2BEA67|nr:MULTISPECIES: response regulator [unclassified Microcoleus]MCC3416649.1 response regulator [Microcoleus sp. PH2017_07_MST_O_A]MCC3430864.1 response regulator [Microcoleus sp. PH2017_04_SCI_O_A]MCC3443308.1 response regulator [Microcoleus sp. PH2017_03_ELD_O_A]MCC3464621.1 response regulator [Microcoleus sp. PH2017_06_SFM_O_A]MCC3503810.1 response regulator [Microcoleus sp. PH2017_19_SFW_U_A]MCC3508371.1 response regulator [Microcoleus sp. PH2017_17_BER_D_A]TAE12843.1 MAG: response regulat